MIFSVIRRIRHRRVLREPFPQEWMTYIEQNYDYWRYLNDDERERLKKLTQVFIADKYWEGGGGMDVTEEMKVTIAAQACLLLLNIEHDFYRMLQTIIIYPTGYFVPSGREIRRTRTEGQIPVLGQAHFQGPVILSWQHVLEGGRDSTSGRNLVYHEFAHKLDMKDGIVDGTPIIRDQGLFREWVDVMSREFNALRHNTGRQPTLLRDYGATNPGEFFAVATEVFFERPLELRQQHPDMYRLLSAFFQQDPAERLQAARSA
jgi:MtfA peptidase